MSASQRVRYLQDDGSLLAGRENAIIVSEGDVAAAAQAVTSTLPPGLFVGIATRETNLARNEIDDDLDENGDVKDTTYGIYQLTPGEAARALVLSASVNPKAMCDLDTASEVAAPTFQRLADAIANAAGLGAWNPRDVDPTFWAFVGLAHNLGLGVDKDSDGKHRAIAIVQTMGLDWEAVKANPPFGLVTQIQTRNGPYGDAIIDCVNRFPFDQSTADDGSAPTSSFDAFTFRKIIAITVVLILALLVVSMIFPNVGKAIKEAV